MANVDTSTLSDAVKRQYERRLLMRAIPRLVHGRWAMKAQLRGYGSLEWRKYSALSAITTALTEGATPAEQASPTITTVVATPSWYGAWLGWTDKFNLESFDGDLSWISGVLGEQAGVSADTLIRNAMTDGAGKLYSGAASSRATLDAPGDNVTYKDVLIIIATIRANSALPAAGDRLIAIIHPHTFSSLMMDATFVNLFTRANSDGDGNPLRSGYLGTLLGIDFYESANAREYADGGVSTTDTYSMLIIGKESYGCVSMGGLVPADVDSQGPGYGTPPTGDGKAVSPVSLIVKQLGSGGTEDPLNQRATAGWKFTEDIQILNSSWILDLEHTNIMSDS